MALINSYPRIMPYWSIQRAYHHQLTNYDTYSAIFVSMCTSHESASRIIKDAHHRYIYILENTLNFY